MDGREDKDAQNSSTENPSVAPGAIFTPQEELIEVEETTPTVEPPAVIQPIPVNPNATVSTGTGDIKLPGEKKSHKKVWIAFVIVALLGVIAAGVVFAITNGALKGSSTSQMQNAKKAFDRYATYALFGEAKDELDGEYDRSYFYKLREEFFDTEYNAHYWDKAEELLAKAIENNSSIKDSANSSLSNSLLAYQKDFLLTKNIKRLGTPPKDQMIDTLVQYGNEAARKYVDSFYSDLSEYVQSNTEDIISNLIKQYQSYVDLLDYGNQKGCISNSRELDSACMDNILSNEAPLVKPTLVSYDEASRVVNTASYALVQELERRCWALDQRFEAPTASSEEEL